MNGRSMPSMKRLNHWLSKSCNEFNVRCNEYQKHRTQTIIWKNTKIVGGRQSMQGIWKNPQEGGRMQGWESKCWGGFPYLRIEKLPNCRFMLFDRYEIHNQASVDFISPIFIISGPHLHMMIKNEMINIPPKTIRRRSNIFEFCWFPYL